MNFRFADELDANDIQTFIVNVSSDELIEQKTISPSTKIDEVYCLTNVTYNFTINYTQV
jgi:hypothetical protein